MFYFGITTTYTHIYSFSLLISHIFFLYGGFRAENAASFIEFAREFGEDDGYAARLVAKRCRRTT